LLAWKREIWNNDRPDVIARQSSFMVVGIDDDLSEIARLYLEAQGDR
jgi:hypothetical protein